MIKLGGLIDLRPQWLGEADVYTATSKDTDYWKNEMKEIVIKKKPFTIFDQYSYRSLARGYALPYTVEH